MKNEQTLRYTEPLKMNWKTGEPEREAAKQELVLNEYGAPVMPEIDWASSIQQAIGQPDENRTIQAAIGVSEFETRNIGDAKPIKAAPAMPVLKFDEK